MTIVVTGRDEEEMRRSREAVREQLAFYGTTPAYLPVFELEGYGDLHPELKRLANESRCSGVHRQAPARTRAVTMSGWVMRRTVTHAITSRSCS